MALPADIEERASATAFMSMGWAYLLSAETLSKEMAHLPSYCGSVVDHMVGQCVELLFKAQLRHAGVSAKDLATSPKYRHGLASLLVAAKGAGLLVVPTAQESAASSILDTQFGQQPYSTRYPYTGTDKSVAPLLLGIARRTMDEVQKRLQPTRVENARLETQRHPQPECSANTSGMTVEQAAEAIGELLKAETSS